ncbi:unnamed protein product [Euphydryas editha]|uniref:C2H2-type domain-containing protein n=1 Tax=Euphydryas editha TaxID=104508 RepID=A0AAU9UVC2_EUPED|nr:unnamed protein product [Euphydryas editha]
MSTGEDEPSSGLNGRLRPRKSTIPSPQTTKTLRKPDSKPAQERPKRTITPSKVSPNKLDDLNDKSDTPALQILCPYCDKSFISKLSISKHIRRIHILTSKQDNVLNCLFCNHIETDSNDIIRHMVDNHPNQYFACYDCHTRFPSTTELAEHKLHVCDKQKLPYRSKLRQKTTQKKNEKTSSNHGRDDFENDDKNYSGHTFNGIVISCELKPAHPNDPIDIEDNITTNLILPSSKSLGNANVIEKNAIIVLDDLQWNKRIPSNFSFHNTDADQILSRLGVVHKSPRTGDNNKKDWFRHIEDSHQKFEKCFDTSFYSKVASNVQENLTKFLDGSFNFNPDPENTIKTRKAKNSVPINTVEGFPILLAGEQFSRNVFDGYLPRTIAPKHKWKWDNLESDKNLMSPEQIKRDSHTNNCIITLVSSLDIWTQLCMRRKFEKKFNSSPIEKKTEKQSIIGKELKEILESRELPTSSSQVVKYTSPPLQVRDDSDFPASLGLVPNVPNFDLKPAVLSGEWVRPRCYVCCACGAQTRDSKALSSHISTQHPNAQIQYYEIVGEVLLNSDILKHLYVPPSQLNNRTRPLRGFRECTKCRKGVSLEDLHQHMLDCAGDTPTVRRKCRYRPFGVRKRRPRLPDNTIRKEMRKDIRHSRHNRKTLMRPRPKIRSEVGDAETIRKMLADLPAKRHRVIVNPLNPTLRPRRKLNKQRTKLVMKKRPIEEMTKKSHSSDKSHESTSRKNQDSQKSLNDSEKSGNNSSQPINQSIKRVASGTLSQKGSLQKKNTVAKNKRKTFVPKSAKTNTETSDLPAEPTESDSNQNIDQLSLQSNSERINLNESSHNTREHGDRNNRSNKKDDEHPGCSGQNSNSRDSFAPSQNAPLKHSIASLTASSETHDKSVQFHQLFLIQQECNNVNQHLPSGQKMLFENEAVVTKLDKPPLHFSHSEILDPQGFQRNKLNKPRKGLNDCIAMLKNKLVEPTSSTLPGHVSVQCGSDEPLGPEPVVIERRHSTTDSNIVDTAQRSLQMLYPNKTVDDIPLSYDTSSRVTRRSSTRHSSRLEKFADVQSSTDFIYWNQLYYNKQLLAATKTNQKYNKQESSRRRSVVSTEDLLLQHAMNLELLANTNINFKNVTDYQFPNITPHKISIKNRQERQKTRSNSNTNTTKSKSNDTSRSKQKKIIDSNNSHKNSHPKIPDIDLPSKKLNDNRFENNIANNTNVTSITENIDHYHLHGRVEDKTPDLSIEKAILHPSNLPEEQLCTRICQNMPVMQYTNEYDIVPVHYKIPIDSTMTAPLDLTNKTIVDGSRRYVPKQLYCAESDDDYEETLDLSNKHTNNLSEKEVCIIDNEVVDLRVTNNSQPLLSRSTPLPPEDNITEIPYGHPSTWPSEADDCLPTDLSMKRNNVPTSSYEKRRIYDTNLEMNVIQHLSHPRRHVQDICVIMPKRDDLDNEEPTDLSNWRSESRSNGVCISEEQHVRLNVYSNKSNHNDEEIPADFSGRSQERIHANYYIDESRMPQYLETILTNTHETRSLIDSEQIISAHYNLATRGPLQASNLEPRSVITYSEPILNETQNIPTSNLLSTSSVTPDFPVPIRRTSLNESVVHNEVNYVISEIPQSLSTKSISENNICNLSHRKSLVRDYEYENTTPACTSQPFIETDSSSVSTADNINGNMPTVYTVADPVNDTSTVYDSSSPSVTHNPNTIDSRKLSSENEVVKENKHLLMEKSPVSNQRSDSTNENKEALKEKNNLDQDPETARKIAMLPKELVEILGNMPVDHRNQLLNVLPQYVSSSTSPVLLSQNTDNARRDSMSSPTHNNNQLEIEYKTGLKSEDERSLLKHTSSSQILQYTNTSPTTVSSSILLTPPTPQLSERHSNQSHENDDVKIIECRGKSRISIDEETQQKDVTSEIMSEDSYTVDEYDGQDRIIDLTGDEISTKTLDISNNCEQLASLQANSSTCPSKDISSSMKTPKSKVVKTKSDKTASLRAVRIKTSSERRRSVLAESTTMKKSVDSTSNLIEEEQKNKDSHITSLMAIQQAEISSTQNRLAPRMSPTVPIISPTVNTCSEEPDTRKISIENKKDLDSDLNYNMPDKQNVVTSSLLNTNCDLKDGTKNDTTCKIIKNESSKSHVSLNYIDEPSSKIIKDLNMNPKASESLLKNKVMVENESLISPSSEKQSAIDDDDSEDDVTLDVIVKQKNRDLLASRDDQKLYEKENTKKESKKIDQKISDKLPSDQQNPVLLSCNKTISTEVASLYETQSLKNSVDSSNNISSLECSENFTKEEESYSKKKGRKGRRVNILGTTQYVEKKEQLCNTKEIDSEHEINKENNVSSDIAKNVEIIDDPVKNKLIDLDNIRSTTTNTVVINDKDVYLHPPARKEKTKTNLNLSIDSLPSDSAYDLNSETTMETRKAVVDISKEDSDGNYLLCTSKTLVPSASSKDISNKLEQNSEMCTKIKSSENSNKKVDNQINVSKNLPDINNIVESKDIHKTISKVENFVENKRETEIDETNVTPLRRSRRGKSLFIDSNSLMGDNILNAGNCTEQRAPLTKKQLIFSKLLLDEENLNRPIITTTPNKETAKSVTITKYENQQKHDDSEEINKFDIGENKPSKRKKSPQSKRKCKKKKSSTNIQNTDDKLNPVEEVNKVSNILGSDNVPSEGMLSSPQVTSNVQSIVTPMADPIADPKKLAEKRKSTSPDKEDLLSVSKSKICKLSNEENLVLHTKIPEEEMTEYDSKEDTAPIMPRNTTCYNKAIRRARSKSVVVKSSGVEFYDPYDIDLEDMVDKTEPFVRKEICPKSRVTPLKSAVAIKTRKLSKTAPSAIIDILPSDATPAAADTENDKLNINKTIITSEYNNNSSVNKKDGSSDSDESSKSDVPLQKYVEVKEKKLLEVTSTSKHVEKSTNDEQHMKSRDKRKRKKHKQSQVINAKEQKVVSDKTETEEELRSEQFMESFGFFSERKPRKSNLLATKKITETFNLIENDDVYFATTERVAKKSTNDNKKDEQAKAKSIIPLPKKATKRGRRKKRRVKIKPSFCNICKKVFRRWDNYVRHLLSLYHISRLCEIELKVKTVLIEEEPNYLLAYRQQLNRLKVLQNKIAKRKKNCLSTADIVLPTLEEILADVKRTIREQQLSRRSLSRDEALFIDCCEMLKESHKSDVPTVNKRVRQCNSFNCAQACQEELALLEKSILDDRCDIKSDEEMDSVAAKKILESEEVRNLENDLISNLKEANGIKGPLTGVQIESSATFNNSITDSQTILSNYETINESTRPKHKRHNEIKEKMYPDIVENIDMFEDKFDKIKRKCRSQAAAAKQIQPHVESNLRHKNRKKSEKKKVNNRKVFNNTVPTKAALKGFDGIKVSILTSDIDMSAIVPSVEKVHRKKRKGGSKKKRDRTNSEKSSHHESDHSIDKSPQKKVDVYEFMDTEDTEVFEFRPSTLMERFKSINNKEMPSTSKSSNEVEFEVSSESGSDGDDFVYMSDDYVCSDDETENSILSCELGNVKGANEPNKTPSLLKRKEITEKNAVMGKIFKHNAVRTEKKITKNTEIVNPKANLDQLFDSLLEDEPKKDLTVDDVSPEKDENPPSRVYLSLSPQKDDQSKFTKSVNRYDQALTITSETGLSKKYSTPSPTLHPSLSSFSVRRKSTTPPRKIETNVTTVSTLENHASSTKRNDELKKCETELKKEYDTPKEVYSKKFDSLSSKSEKLTATNTDNTQRRRSDEYYYEKQKLKNELYKEKNDKKKKEEERYESIGFDEESFENITTEDAGVARQRARRKCTVGKQNVLAETWSSESEPDGVPPRPNSAESVIVSSGRKKKGRKRDGQSSGSRKASRPVAVKRHDHESKLDRVGSNNRAGSGVQVRTRSPPYYWSEGDDEQEHPQQHGWIVGDSHKKLVTMLAHAKGRKRSGDEKRHLLE